MSRFPKRRIECGSMDSVVDVSSCDRLGNTCLPRAICFCAERKGATFRTWEDGSFGRRRYLVRSVV